MLILTRFPKSTLRYANRAKNIINKPTINEDPNVKYTFISRHFFHADHAMNEMLIVMYMSL